MRLLGGAGLAAMLALQAAVAGAEVIRVEPDGPGLQAAIDRARPDDVLDLGDGLFRGSVFVDQRVTLRGDGAVIDGNGEGTPVVIGAAGARIENLTIQNSGQDVSGPDSCIYIEPSATGAVVQHSILQRCGFGIWIHETEGVQILENRIQGRAEQRSTDRGNGIQLFDASKLVIRGNHVTDTRDGIYVSATEDSLIQGNTTSGVRFGIHYMYSYRNTLRGNVANENTIGIALMESGYLIVEENRAVANKRNGLLFRDVQFSQIRRNQLEANGNGMFFYSSTENVIEDNQVFDNEMGLKIWAGSRRNQVSGNVIRGNRVQVYYVGAEDQVWGESGPGNYWSDYLGWDQNGDGIGDRPHRVDSFTTGLLHRYPSAVLLLRSPALEALTHLADRLPLLRTPTIVDRAPRLGPPDTAAERGGL